MEKTYFIKTKCNCCGKQAIIIGYEKVSPEEVLTTFISKGGKCSACQANQFGIVS